MTTVDIQEAKAKLHRAIGRVEGDEEISVARESNRRGPVTTTRAMAEVAR